MKSFAFGLEKVLNLRKYREDEAKVELGRAIGILTELESRLRSLAFERASAAAAQFSPGNSIAVMQQYMFYLFRLDSLKEQLLREAALAEMEVEKARNVFIETSRERKILDKFKEKRQNEYHKDMLNEETKILDEISSGAPARQSI